MTTAAALLREARSASHLTQRQVAERAGMTQSVVSAYESGRREPSVAMLERLLDATGHRLDLTVSAAPQRGQLHAHVLGHAHELTSIAERRGLHSLQLFGSAARGDDGPDSDVDLLAELGPTVTLLGLIGAEQEMSDLLGVKVDLVPIDQLKPDVRARALADAIPL